MTMDLLLPLRILQGAFALIVLGLSAYVANWYDKDTLTASPPQIDFLVFAPVWTIVSLAYLEITPRWLRKVSHPYVHLAFEGLNVMFYFAGFIALAVFLGKLLFCRGSVCAAARADAVFAAFSWILWCGSAALLGMKLFKKEVGHARMEGKSSVMRETSVPVGGV